MLVLIGMVYNTPWNAVGTNPTEDRAESVVWGRQETSFLVWYDKRICIQVNIQRVCSYIRCRFRVFVLGCNFLLWGDHTIYHLLVSNKQQYDSSSSLATSHDDLPRLPTRLLLWTAYIQAESCVVWSHKSVWFDTSSVYTLQRQCARWTTSMVA